MLEGLTWPMASRKLAARPAALWGHQVPDVGSRYPVPNREVKVRLLDGLKKLQKQG